MIFNSIEFAVFLTVVLLLYWFPFSKSAKSQNLILLTGSLFFYGWADWRFLGLILLNAIVNFYLGIKITDVKKEKTKQQLFWVGVVFNVGVLLYFKYFNFFYDSFVDMFNVFGNGFAHSALKIIIPVGVSFFTFQTLAYLIDVYHEEIEPNRDALTFTTYVTYFPKLLAGPIERAQKFFPQVEVKRKFDYALAADGFRQILWGLFKKVVIADNCLMISNQIFKHYDTLPASTLVLGAFFNLVEIYADFSGYSEMAVGISKLFGIRLMNNFAYPFFATNISFFWKRWHISLTSWLMDYVFTPLSFILRQYKRNGVIISIFITFIIVGLWHGPRWTYIIFGFLQGCYFLPLIMSGTMNQKEKVSASKWLPSFNQFTKMTGVFILIMVTAVLLRIETVSDSFHYLTRLFSKSLFSVPVLRTNKLEAFIAILFIFIMLFVEWIQRDKEFGLQVSTIRSSFVRWTLYYSIILVIFMFSSSGQEFIYFHF